MNWTDVAVIAPICAGAVGIFVLVQLRKLIKRIDFVLVLISSRTKPPEGGPNP